MGGGFPKPGGGSGATSDHRVRGPGGGDQVRRRTFDIVWELLTVIMLRAVLTPALIRLGAHSGAGSRQAGGRSLSVPNSLGSSAKLAVAG